MTNTLTNQSDPVAEIMEFMMASIKKDRLFMQSHLHEAFLFTTPRGTLFNLESFLGDFLENPKFVIELFGLLEHTVFRGDRFCIVNGVTRIRFSGQEEQYERMTYVLSADADQWKILSIQGTFTTRPASV